jgi:hypothetical protein
LGGANQIHCQLKTMSYPPAAHWKWNDGSLKPFCKGNLVFHSKRVIKMKNVARLVSSSLL